MTQAESRFRTFEEYAALDPSELPEGNYELVDGVIVEMGAENDQNLEIVSFLFSVFLQFVPYNLLRRGTEIAVPSRLVTSKTYKTAKFRGNDQIKSSTFPTLALTAQQILAAGEEA